MSTIMVSFLLDGELQRFFENFGDLCHKDISSLGGVRKTFKKLKKEINSKFAELAERS